MGIPMTHDEVLAVVDNAGSPKFLITKEDLRNLVELSVTSGFLLKALKNGLSPADVKFLTDQFSKHQKTVDTIIERPENATAFS
jgi:hypothetical protein